jgi:hypothetical protein
MGKRPEWLPRREKRGGDPALLPVELLDLVVRTYTVVKRLGVKTVQDLLDTTSAIDIAVSPGSDMFCVDNVAARLDAAGVDHAAIEAWRRAPARLPIPPIDEGGEPWGLLFLTGDRSQVVEAIEAAYRTVGLVPNPNQEALLNPQRMETHAEFGLDHLMHYQAADRIVVVLSQRFELAPLENNPLAAAVSFSLGTPVYAFLQDATKGSLGAYEEGRLIRAYATAGSLAVPVLDLAELPLSESARESLDGLRHNLPAMLRLLAIRSYGHRHARWDHFVDVHASPDDVDTSSLLAFTTR